MSDLLSDLLATTPAPPFFVGAWARHLQLKEKLGELGKPHALDLLLIGDSLCEGWPAAYWEPWRTWNLGVGGDRTQHVLWRLDDMPSGVLDPERILLLVGVNNIWGGETAGGIAAGVERVMSRLAQLYPHSKRWIIATPPFEAPNPGFASERHHLRKELLDRFGDACLTVDGVFLDGEGGARAALYTEDGIHISAEGYAALTRHLKAHLAR